VLAFGDVVRITDYAGNRFEFLYTEVIDPVEASASDLKDTLDLYLQTIVGGGGGGSGTVTSVGLSVPSPTTPAFTVSGSPVTGSGTLAIAATGTTSDYVRGDGSRADLPAAIQSVIKELYEESVYNLGTSSGSVRPLYVASADLLYIPYTGNVAVYNVTTGQRMVNIALASAFACFYIASIDEVWATNTANGTITRLSTASTPTNIGTITGSGNGGRDWVEFSATKVFITNFSSNNITVVNPTTLAVDATIAGVTNAAGLAYCNNPSSAHYQRCIVTQVATGVSLLDPATNSITIAATTFAGAFTSAQNPTYCDSQDRWVVPNFAQAGQLIWIEPLTATTWSIEGNSHNITYATTAVYDAVNDYIFSATTSESAGTPRNLYIVVIDPATKQVVKGVTSMSFATAANYFIAKNTGGNFIFFSAVNSRTTTKVIYT
jgi:hypothetical protein